MEIGSDVRVQDQLHKFSFLLYIMQDFIFKTKCKI